VALDSDDEWARLSRCSRRWQLDPGGPRPLSVDSATRARRTGLGAGRDIINDVTGLRDAGMLGVAAARPAMWW